jgi:hypothetical protein
VRDALWDAADPMPAISEPLRQIKNLVAADVVSVLRKLGVRRRRPEPRSLAGQSPVDLAAKKDNLGA